MIRNPYYYGPYMGAEPSPTTPGGRTASSFREHRGPIVGPGGPVVRDHREPDGRVTTPPFRPPVQPPIVVQPPTVRPPVVQPPVVHPPVVQPPVVVQPPKPQPSPEHPPRPHHEHGDYVFVPGYEWWPRWFPYWDPYWNYYWQYLYWYYQGYNYPEYAEWARDAYLRSIAPQWGWF